MRFSSGCNGVCRAGAAAIFALLLAALTLPQTRADQEPEAALADHPLRLADTSSPRETLRSFLLLSEELVLAWRRDGDLSDDVYVALRGLQETMDFSTTAHGNSNLEQTRRILMLREILDRIDLPPLEDVPDASQMTQDGTQVWTIPETRIRIRLENEGERAGDYLFSAGTTEALDLYYRRVKDLPYKPGAFPILEDWLVESGHGVVDLRERHERLTGIDASSPRSLLEEFLFSVNAAYDTAWAAEAALNESPPLITDEEADIANLRAEDLMRRAGTAFDLSEVPEAGRYDTAIESALLLKEILDRTILPPIEAVPDSSALETLGPDATAYTWRLPDLSIEVVHVNEGDRAGEFLFSAETVAGLRATYESLRDLPYRTDRDLRSVWEYRSMETSPGFYETYISTPGQFVPSANMLGRLLISLPGFMHELHLDQTRWQWTALVLTVLVAWALCYGIFRVTGAAARRFGPPVFNWFLVLAPVGSVIVVQEAADFLDEDINMTGEPLAAVVALGHLAALLFSGWAVWRFCMAIATTTLSTSRFSKGGIDASLIRVIAALAAIAVVTGMFIAGLRDLGVDAIPLLGGLGISGLAIALAVRPTLENLISGIVLFTDKPIEVGDFCSFGTLSGTIESIGVRSTQVRADDRTLISIPNAKFANMELINWAKQDRMMINETLRLRYDSSADQLRFVLVGIREMLHAHPRIHKETIRARFAGYGESSLNIKIDTFVMTRNWGEFFAVREDVFFRIKEIVEASGTAFAIPSRTLYMGRDAGLEDEKAQAAAQQIRSLRESGNLPFPDHAEERLRDLEGTLDYPPRGSPDARQADRKADVAKPVGDERSAVDRA